MLGENIRAYRKARGLSQEELAAKLCVVRQTVSKWEKGLSVPDSEMLMTLADALGVSVAELLGENTAPQEAPTLQSLAAKLEILNEQFAKKAERNRKIWRTLFLIVGSIAVLSLFFELIPLIYYFVQTNAMAESSAIGIIGGADWPTAILVSSSFLRNSPLVISVFALIVSLVGLYKTK